VIAAKKSIDPADIDGLTTYKLLTGCIVPRPIGFISTVSLTGVFNAAPFSFFNGISHNPPMLCFSSQRRDDDRDKDTLINVRDVGDFVANIVDEAVLDAMAVCAIDFPADISEFERAGLTPVPSRVVRAPAIAEAPVNLECRVLDIRPLPESTYTLVIARVEYFHVRADLCAPDGKVDPHGLRAVGRMAGNLYTRTAQIMSTQSHVKVK
jgi:flavin reductase (DIM6/NTAB) family NADH-FMN oxidoreductase RutF